MANVPDRSQENRNIQAPQSKMIAKCGHEDPLGYLSNTVCSSCAKKNHKKAMRR